MRRVTVPALRIARPGYARANWSSSRLSSQSQHGRGFRYANNPQHGLPLPILQSSLFFRNVSWIVATLVAGGAFFAYNREATAGKGLQLNSTQRSSNSSVLGSLGPSSAFSTSSQAVPSTTGTEAVAEPSRRALVVENDQFYAGDIIGDEPISKQTDASGRLVVEMLTPEQATQKLRQNEQSYLVGRGQGVVRYDVIQVASNNPIEDDHAEKIVQHHDATASSSSDWMFWGVFDGHSGWTTSAKLRQVLISFVARELNATYKAAQATSALSLPSSEAIDAAIKKGFVRLDNEIVYDSVEKVSHVNTKLAAAELLAPAFSGSCALLSFYDSRSKLLRVACTGDSRAVLGRKGAGGKWTATPLSDDQTGGTPSENARLRREHPGEEYVTRNGRILGGLEPSRAFGDAIYKWTQETQKKIKAAWFGRTPSSLLKTPPYVTAEPVVTTTKIEPSNGDFVVMATDGLWECLTNEEVIGLVGQWIDSHGKGNKRSFSNWFGYGSKNGLPVENHAAKGGGKGGQRAPIRQQQWAVAGGDERFVIEDENAATHLVRNALGGRDQDMVCALLTLPAPYSRRYRDDLTVEVIFFGERTNVAQNPDAATLEAGVKAKL